MGESPVSDKLRQPIPHGSFWLVVLLLGAAGGALFFLNYANLQMPFSRVVAADPRNAGIEVKAHYGNYYDLSVLVFDVRRIEGEKAPLDVFRIFLQYAAEVKDRHFDHVVLASRGMEKFQLKGDYFNQLGREYGEQNPMYTARSFAENLFTPDGKRAYETWTGGLLGVLGKQMEDFGDFHKRWYIEDLGKN